MPPLRGSCCQYPQTQGSRPVLWYAVASRLFPEDLVRGKEVLEATNNDLVGIKSALVLENMFLMSSQWIFLPMLKGSAMYAFCVFSNHFVSCTVFIVSDIPDFFPGMFTKLIVCPENSGSISINRVALSAIVGQIRYFVTNTFSFSGDVIHNGEVASEKLKSANSNGGVGSDKCRRDISFVFVTSTKVAGNNSNVLRLPTKENETKTLGMGHSTKVGRINPIVMAQSTNVGRCFTKVLELPTKVGRNISDGIGGFRNGERDVSGQIVTENEIQERFHKIWLRFFMTQVCHEQWKYCCFVAEVCEADMANLSDGLMPD